MRIRKTCLSSETNAAEQERNIVALLAFPANVGPGLRRVAMNSIGRSLFLSKHVQSNVCCGSRREKSGCLRITGFQRVNSFSVNCPGRLREELYSTCCDSCSKQRGDSCQSHGLASATQALLRCSRALCALVQERVTTRIHRALRGCSCRTVVSHFTDGDSCSSDALRTCAGPLKTE